MKILIVLSVIVFSSSSFASAYEFLCKGAFDPQSENTSVYLLKVNSNDMSASLVGSKKINLEFRAKRSKSVIFDTDSLSSHDTVVLEEKLFNGRNGAIFAGDQSQNYYPIFASCVRN